MDQRSPAFEATLLYRAVPRPDRARLIEDITSLLQAHGATLHFAEQVDRVFTLLACDTVQVLLAFTDAPMPIEHFLDSHRPVTADLSEPAMLARLTDHRAATTVLVMDADDGAPRGAGEDTLKRDICWDVTEHIFRATAPEVVFWNETDTLFSDAEFERTCLYLDQLAMVSAQPEAAYPARLPVFFEAEPAINLTELDLIDARAEAEDAPASDAPRRETLDTLMSLALPNRLALRLDHLQGTLDKRRSVKASALACTALTVGLTSLPNLTVLIS